MSSLTDIIFLLLIFFMLTSSAVQINMDLPQSVSKTVAPTDLAVMIKKNGDLSVNGKPTTWAKLDRDVATAVRYSNNKDNATVSIIAESGVAYGEMHKIMKVAAGLGLRAIVATAPPKN